MRNAVSLFKHYPPGRNLSRRVRLTLVAAAVSCATLAGVAESGGDLATRPAPVAASLAVAQSPRLAPLPGKPSPALAAILLPRHAPAGAYRLAVLDQPIEAARAVVMAALAPDARVDDPPGAWTIRQSEPVEAFGEGGIYDRSRLARLFAGKPAQLARAPIQQDGQVTGSVTLLSPCPDPQLSRLSPATIVILFDVAAAKAR